MQFFKNVLFVSRGMGDDVKALKQTIWFVNRVQASVKILIICPEFPKSMEEYKNKYEISMREQFEKSLNDILNELKISNMREHINVEVEYGATPAVRIIRNVLRNGHDLVIKGADKVEQKGFKSVDMELLRKCPSAVWLCRPNDNPNKNIHLAVAIDPESEEPEGHDLSLHLLKISNLLADTYNVELNLVSCWDYELEEYLRNSIWIDQPENKLQQMLTDIQIKNRYALDSLIKESKFNKKINIDHFKGLPEHIIPSYVSNKNIDLLIMGTVARTGIQGFLIGNTAENVVQKITCSILALKPNGFVSSIKAY